MSTQADALDGLYRHLLTEANDKDLPASPFNAGLRTGYRGAAQMVLQLRAEVTDTPTQTKNVPATGKGDGEGWVL